MANTFISLSSMTANNSAGGSWLFTLISFAIIIIFFYFILIRPQKKKDKEAKAMRESIQIGDEIMTIGGIVGIVVRKNEDTVVIETGGDKSKLRIKSWAVQENLTMTEKAAEAARVAKAAKTKGADMITTGKSKKDKE
ncbi:MAG: preprotein translocase subunit YajC [Porcipelethomonas sp.]